MGVGCFFDHTFCGGNGTGDYPVFDFLRYLNYRAIRQAGIASLLLFLSFVSVFAVSQEGIAAGFHEAVIGKSILAEHIFIDDPAINIKGQLLGIESDQLSGVKHSYPFNLVVRRSAGSDAWVRVEVIPNPDRERRSRRYLVQSHQAFVSDLVGWGLPEVLYAYPGGDIFGIAHGSNSGTLNENIGAQLFFGRLLSVTDESLGGPPESAGVNGESRSDYENPNGSGGDYFVVASAKPIAECVPNDNDNAGRATAFLVVLGGGVIWALVVFLYLNRKRRTERGEKNDGNK